MISKVIRERTEWFQTHHVYQMIHWDEWDYSILSMIRCVHKSGRGDNKSFNDIIVFADTETSKKKKDTYRNRTLHKTDGTIVKKKTPNPQSNHVCAWTITLRAYSTNLVTLWGHRPSTFCECMSKILSSMKGEETYVYFHNLSFDYYHLRRFLFKSYGYPVKELNTKPHYPIRIDFANGLIIRDSLILAQRSLDKWGEDLNVEHKKAVGKWDYNKRRSQTEVYNKDELEYIEHDTLCGAECIDVMLKTLNKQIYSIYYTATGIPRNEIREIGRMNNAKQIFNKQSLDYDQYCIMKDEVYHGGYTHGNRFYLNKTIKELVKCFDFASSYPFVLLSEKYPCEKFTPIGDMKPEHLLKDKDEYAFYFKFCAKDIELKSIDFPMPCLSVSKCGLTLDVVSDNGRVLQARYLECWLTETDLEVVDKVYRWDTARCRQIQFAKKDYLPRYFTDYVYKLFYDKCVLKKADPYDPVAYALAKAKLNSLYGLCVTACIKPEIKEDFETGEYEEDENYNPIEMYEKYLKKRGSILPYQWGVWCTSYAFRNLFVLGDCFTDDGEWLYSDTDSCYGWGWDESKIQDYNQRCKDKLAANNYGAVLVDGKEFWLGVAEHDGVKDTYTEYRYQGAKRYCGRCLADGELHLTVAGVPKKEGVKCLKDDIENFKPNFVFDGVTSGKLLHTYVPHEIYVDEKGNETADSINLTNVDYILDMANVGTWESFFEEEIYIQCYEV